MKASPLTSLQAALVSLVTLAVGQVVAFVPSLAPDQSVLISAGTALIAAVFLIGNAIHAVADSNTSAADLKEGGLKFLESEVEKVDFNQLAKDAVDAQSCEQVEASVRAEVQRVLARLAQPS